MKDRECAGYGHSMILESVSHSSLRLIYEEKNYCDRNKLAVVIINRELLPTGMQ